MADSAARALALALALTHAHAHSLKQVAASVLGLGQSVSHLSHELTVLTGSQR